VRLPFFPADERIVDSTGALNLKSVPKKMLIVGGGIIGLEMGTVYSTLGARLDVVEMMDGLMQGADRDLVKVWQKMNAPRFDNIMLKTKTVGAEATPEGIKVKFEAADGTTSEQVYDLVLQAVGRTPNGKKIGAEAAGVAVGERGFIRWMRRCAPTCRTSSPSATWWGSPCWPTRRCTRAMWRPRSSPARSRATRPWPAASSMPA
jgi:dihydrolipoamide dehydrogenase